MSQDKPFKIQPYNSKQLAAYYGVSYAVFLAWIEDIREQLGEQKGRTWTIKQVKIIINHCDKPE